MLIDTDTYNTQHRAAMVSIFAAMTAGTTDPYQLADATRKASDRAHLLVDSTGLRPSLSSDEFARMSEAAKRMFLDHYSNDFSVSIEGEGPRYFWSIHEACGCVERDRSDYWLGCIDGSRTLRPFNLAMSISHYMRRLKAHPELHAPISDMLEAICPPSLQDETEASARLTDFTIKVMHLLAEDRIPELERLLTAPQS